jgi:hypothetical protein
MVIVDYSKSELLFTKYDLRSSLEAGRDALTADADKAPITADTTDDEIQQVATALADKHSLTLPVLGQDDEIFTSPERRQRDVSQDFNRAILDPSRPYMMDFETVVFHVPFSGERDFFFMRASTFSFNPPRAEIRDSELRIAVMTEGEVTAAEVKQQFNQEIVRIREALNWVAADIGPNYNEQLLNQARTALEAKRNRQTSTRGLLDELGFKTAPTPATKVKPAASLRQTAQPTEPVSPPSPFPERRFACDFFISHASEDKDEIARPLYDELTKKGYKVWFDEAELHLGDSLIAKIDEGLANCRYGIVVMSPRFFEKRWTQEELKGLRSRQIGEQPGIILPIWKDIDAEFLNNVHPPLAQIKAANFADGLAAVVAEIERVYKR